MALAQERITNSTFTSVMMDDTSGKSNVEQSAFSVRLVYQGEIEEHLLALVDSAEDQSADGLTWFNDYLAGNSLRF